MSLSPICLWTRRLANTSNTCKLSRPKPQIRVLAKKYPLDTRNLPIMWTKKTFYKIWKNWILEIRWMKIFLEAATIYSYNRGHLVALLTNTLWSLNNLKNRGIPSKSKILMPMWVMLEIHSSRLHWALKLILTIFQIKGNHKSTSVMYLKWAILVTENLLFHPLDHLLAWIKKKLIWLYRRGAIKASKISTA